MSAADSQAAGNGKASRPDLSARARQWQTDRPPQIRNTSLLTPSLKRGNTNTSLLSEAIWNQPVDQSADHQARDDSTSDSSSEEESKRGHHGKKGKRSRKTHAVPRGEYSKFDVGNENYRTKGRVSRKDGRLNISINETEHKGYLANALGASILKRFTRDAKVEASPTANEHQESPSRRSSSSSAQTKAAPRPTLNIVVMVIGSRGDIQPFLKLGQSLKAYGHRVRIATHPAFRDFVQNDTGLEFFSVGGDPAELMAFMVKNPGMIPSMDTLKKGEIGRRRQQMAEMFEGFWRACVNATDSTKDELSLKLLGDKPPFIADAIIANPPSFAHLHCAEKLGCPLHIMFTMPFSPTQAFPHPLANIKRTNIDPGYTNFMSYPLVEMVTWQGLGDLVNAFRVNTLGLEPVSTLWAPGQLYRLKVPYTYLWSPGLVPKPKDWGPEIDIAGYVFLELASSFQPPKELSDFLAAGETPIYIGFGSIVVDDPDTFTKTIFDAVKAAGVRALVSKGWGGLGQGETPDDIFLLDNTPHDWLFPQVKAVVHHGGAGTTAIGLKCGKPTMIVPFFGDQPFWGAMIGESGAGAKPVQYKDLDVEKLAAGIKSCLTPEAQFAAQKLADGIAAEGDGAANAVTSFHRSLAMRGPKSLRCSILEERVAVWHLKGTTLRLSALAAEILVDRKRTSWKHLRLIRHCEWNDFEGPGEPVTGGLSAIGGTVTDMTMGVGSVPFKIAKKARRRSLYQAKLKEHEERKAEKRRAKERGQSQTRAQPETTGSSPAGGDHATPPSSNRSATTHSGPVEHGNIPVRDVKHESVSRLNSHEIPQTLATNAMPPISSEDREKLTYPGQDPLSQDSHQPGGKSVSETVQPRPEANRGDTAATTVASIIAEPPPPIVQEIAHEIGTGLGRSAAAIARAPIDLSLAVAQGFHNAPRLYGDTTVRRNVRITGLHSGMKAARHELVYGVYDGVTGLWKLPYHGAKDGGPLGFAKGVGMGTTGFVLKNISAVIGPWGYGLKGLEKELMKGKQRKLTNSMRKARIIQGQRDFRELSHDRQRFRDVTHRVMKGWEVVNQVLEVMVEENMRKGPVQGRWKAWRERRQWRQKGALENVEVAQRAVDMKKQGKNLDDIERAQKTQWAAENVDRPRKNVVDELGKTEGQIGSAQMPHREAL